MKTSLYLYRRIYNLPRNDPRLEGITDLDIELEVEANRLWQRLIAGKSIELDELAESDAETEAAMQAIITSDDESLWEEYFGPALTAPKKNDG